MANRHLARSVVLQTLFEWDFHDGNRDRSISATLEHNANEFAPGIEDIEFPKELAEGVIKKQTILDEIIEKAAPDWPIDKISIVDRNILRLGLYELLFGEYEQVPPKVAINEAIELAKSFGGESSSRFVNGVLGAIYKEIGEPGKDQKSKRQLEDTDLETLPIQRKAGAVIYAFKDGEVQLAMVHDVFGFWTLSKGSINADEVPEKAVVRVVKEEIGLDIETERQLGENEYIANHPEEGRIRKQVKYFLARGTCVPVSIQEEGGGLDDVQWFGLNEVMDLRMYDDVTKLVADAITAVTAQ